MGMKRRVQTATGWVPKGETLKQTMEFVDEVGAKDSLFKTKSEADDFDGVGAIKRRVTITTEIEDL